MKRSEINAIMHQADAFIRQQNFYLPPFAYWTPDEWQRKGPEAKEIVSSRLGWDITDFGFGDYRKTGLFLFTLRNGHPENWKTLQGKLYAEKLLIVDEQQETPLHFHWSKMEDIINRGGGKLCIKLYQSTPEEGLDEVSEVQVAVDSMWRRVPPGGIVSLSPGESISLPPYCYHSFWAEGGRVLAGEVSMVNDDERDNRFYQTLPRYPAILEDEPPLYLLCTDYPRYYSWN